MNLDTASVLNFSPVDPDLWEVTFTAEADTWTLPVIGFAVVVTYNGKDDGELSETALYPVLLDEAGYPVSVRDYMSQWDKNRPQWSLKRKA